MEYGFRRTTACGRPLDRVLTLVDQYARGASDLRVYAAPTGEKVATALDDVIAFRGTPKSITMENRTEFTSEATITEHI